MPSFVDFHADIKRLVARGLTQVDCRTASYDTSNYKGGLVLSHHKNESHIEPEMLVVNNIRELKELNGMPDEEYTSGRLQNHHQIPPALHSSFEADLHPNHKYICDAISVFLYGNSQLVSSYEDKINELRFPMKVAIFSGKDIVVKSGTTLTLGTQGGRPFAAHFDNITVEAGGEIVCKSAGKVSAQHMDYNKPALANATAASAPASFLSLGGDGGDAGNGGTPGQAPTGSKGTNGTGDKHSCTTKSGKGGTGQPGSIGGMASPGGPGGASAEINVSVDNLSGTFVAGSVGGNGGNGGTGGTGGQGGNGGPGGKGHTSTDSDKNCADGPQGQGGVGGQGGPGGAGGKGGDGKKVYINWKTGSPSITVSTAKANGGKGGDGGPGGAGGTGDPDGKRGTGGDGKPGGAGGTPGQVILNGPSTFKIL